MEQTVLRFIGILTINFHDLLIKLWLSLCLSQSSHEWERMVGVEVAISMHGFV